MRSAGAPAACADSTALTIASTHIAVARISNPTLRNALGNRRCANASVTSDGPAGIPHDVDDQDVGVRVEERNLLIQLLQRERRIGRSHRRNPDEPDPDAARRIDSAEEEVGRLRPQPYGEPGRKTEHRRSRAKTQHGIWPLRDRHVQQRSYRIHIGRQRAARRDRRLPSGGAGGRPRRPPRPPSSPGREAKDAPVPAPRTRHRSLRYDPDAALRPRNLIIVHRTGRGEAHRRHRHVPEIDRVRHHRLPRLPIRLAASRSVLRGLAATVYFRSDAITV